MGNEYGSDCSDDPCSVHGHVPNWREGPCPRCVEDEASIRDRKLAEAADIGNEEAVRLCSTLLDKLGARKEYACAVGSAATALLFHSFRIALPESREHALNMLRVILGDVTRNIRENGGQDITFTVEG